MCPHPHKMEVNGITRCLCEDNIEGLSLFKSSLERGLDYFITFGWTDPLVVFVCCVKDVTVLVFTAWPFVFTCFQVECYDYDSDGSHDLIGTFETTMTRLQEASRTSPVCVFFLHPNDVNKDKQHFKDDLDCLVRRHWPRNLCSSVLPSGRVWMHQQ